MNLRTYYMYFEIYFPDKDVRLPSSPPPFAARIYNIYVMCSIILYCTT